jgi:ribosomal protein S18 acetylase RimI-like enzyme
MDDLPDVAAVYRAAFPDSVQDLGLEDMSPQALVDIFSVCLDAEPEGFLVAELPQTECGGPEGAGMIAGYAICPANVGRLRTVAVWRGHVWRLLWRVLVGRYGIGWRTLRQIWADKLHFWRSSDLRRADCPARMLSLAVHPEAQGRGVGKALFSEGLKSLRRRTDGAIRLEVRPENEVAKRLYERFGFVTVGQVHDTRGPWDVMVLDAETGGDGLQ